MLSKFAKMETPILSMPYVSPLDQHKLVAVDTKARVRTTMTTVFLAVTIVTAVAAVAAAVATILQPVT